MTERVAGPEKIIGVRLENGIVTKMDVRMADGSFQTFVPEIQQPAPITSDYVGKHEKRAGGRNNGKPRY